MNRAAILLFIIAPSLTAASEGKPNPEAVLRSHYPAPFFEGLQMMSPERLLRRVTLSLAGRLPSQNERAAVETQGLEAMDAILDEVMGEDAFYERLKEGFNDIFLTDGYDGNSETVLSYSHFGASRIWYQRLDLSQTPEADHRRMRGNVIRVYRDAIRREPLELITYIVRNDHPFTEVVTADYMMVSPYSARGYGIFEELRDQFKDPDDPFEYIPTKLRALEARDGSVQKSETGYYPHAGLLSMFHYLKRYPTTETNRNRLRARMYYQHFLGIDVMSLIPPATDAAAVTEKHKNPTMQAADCVVCHNFLDPLAGVFQDYDKDGSFAPRPFGWHKDMFRPGLEGTDLPKRERWRSLQWLGEHTARDPRFAVAMVEHVYYILLGRKPLLAPQDFDDPLFESRSRAYQEQRKLIKDVAERFGEAGFNLKVAFKAIVASEFYRVDGLATASLDARWQTELDDLGLVRLLTPEQLERKIEAVFGQRWGQLNKDYRRLDILYGGIDSKEVTERAPDPSGAMGAIHRMMSNEVACKNVSLDFSRQPADRRLFPNIELDIVPRGDSEAEMRIREAIVRLHDHILGLSHSVDHPEVERTFRLFADIIRDAKANQGVAKTGVWFCDRINERRLDDSNYTLRAWRGVVTYLLRQHDFLYE